MPMAAAAEIAETPAVWLQTLTEWVNAASDWVWGLPLIGVVLMTGMLLTLMLRFVHIFNLGRAFRYMFQAETESDAKGEVSQFGALCTALSATIGTGNIVGVATAIGAGGPGALFWMEVAAFFGMATKYAEGLLAVKYREVLPNGHVLGGPFHYIERGLGRKWKWLAVLFALFGVTAGIMGIGTITQINGITSAVQNFFDPGFNPEVSSGLHLLGTTYPVPVVVAGFVVTACVGLVVIGGLKRISTVSMVVVPFMAVFYVAICVLLLLANISKVPAAMALIVRAAFNPAAFTGGVVGSLFIAMQKGVAHDGHVHRHHRDLHDDRPRNRRDWRLGAVARTQGRGHHDRGVHPRSVVPAAFTCGRTLLPHVGARVLCVYHYSRLVLLLRTLP